MIEPADTSAITGNPDHLDAILLLPLHRPPKRLGPDATVGDFLHGLLRDLWERESDFDGKRPYGNSGWQHDLVKPLADGGYVEAKWYFEEGGRNDGSDLYELEDYDHKAFDAIILAAIDRMCSRPKVVYRSGGF